MTGDEGHEAWAHDAAQPRFRAVFGVARVRIDYTFMRTSVEFADPNEIVVQADRFATALTW